jgi:hypothetical protein
MILYQELGLNIFLGREIMRAVKKSICHAHPQKLLLAHRRVLLFLLRLHRDVCPVLELVSQVHQLRCGRNFDLALGATRDAYARAESVGLAGRPHGQKIISR